MRKIVCRMMMKGLMLANGADLFLFSFKRLGNVSKTTTISLTLVQKREKVMYLRMTEWWKLISPNSRSEASKMIIDGC